MEEQKCYKGFRVGEDGGLLSLIVWTISPDSRGTIPPVLSYTEGEITYAPEGTDGIFIEKNLEKGKQTTMDSGGRSFKVIHEITPLGNRRALENSLGRFTTYPAILVGKRVKSYHEPKPVPPEPVWVNITRDCTCSAIGFGPFQWVSIRDPETKSEIALMGPKGIVLYGSKREQYRIVEGDGSSFACGEFRIEKRGE